MQLADALDVEVARWLVSEPGRGVLARATGWLDAGQDVVSVAAAIRREDALTSLEGEVVGRHASAALSAAVARRRARDRWPDADALVLLPEALEQASDPTVSAWRAERFRGREVWDLGAGLGGDAVALARVVQHVTAVDLDAARLVLLDHHAAISEVHVTIRTADALEVRPPPQAWVHADPGRRRDGQRIRRLAEHLPPVGALLAAHAAAPGMGVVLSPAVDLDDPDLPGDAELEFVQVGDRLVEAVAWLRDARRPSASASATLLPGGHTLSRTGPRPPRRPVGEVGDHLVTVEPAAVRARLHDDLAASFEGRRLAVGRALFTTDEAPPSSPWWRSRPVVAVLPARAKVLRSWLRRADARPVEVALHGVEGDPVRWWRELGRPPRGPRGWRVELVRRDLGAVAVVTDAGAG